MVVSVTGASITTESPPADFDRDFQCLEKRNSDERENARHLLAIFLIDKTSLFQTQR